MNTVSMMIVGVGGQGTLLASRVMGDVLLSSGYDVKLSEVHGMSQRGGSVVTYVRYGDRVYSPIVEEGEADLILAFEPLEAARWLPRLKKGGTILVNAHPVLPMPVITGQAAYPEALIAKLAARANVVALDALALAERAGTAKAVNVVLLGRLSRLLPEFPEPLWLSALQKYVKPQFLSTNLSAFRSGGGAAGRLLPRLIIRRGCERTKRSFAAPLQFYLKQTDERKMHNTPYPPEKASKGHSGSVLFFHGFVAELVEVVTDRNEKNLKSDGIDPSAHDSPVPSVVFHNAKCALRLNRTVHSQQCAVDTVQIIRHLPMHRGQLPVDPHRSVLRRLFAFGCIRTAAAILAFKYFLLPSVSVSLHVLSIAEMEGLSIGTAHDAVRINPKFSDRYGFSRYFLSLLSLSNMVNFIYFFMPCASQYR